MKRFNVGIVGYGWAAGAHIAAINATSNGQVTAVCSSRPIDAAELSARHGRPMATYTRLEDMLADPAIHVLDVCSYPSRHREHAVAGARAGKHLIIEKPLALQWQDCCAIADAVRTAGVRTCICLECRWSNQFEATRAVIEQGLLGELHYGEVDYYHGIGPWYSGFRWYPTRAEGGSSLLLAGCHAMDALLLCLGTDVESVFSYGTASKHPTFSGYEFPSTSVTLLRFKNGRVGKVASVVDCWQPYYFHTHLVGSEGTLLDNRFHSTRLQTHKGAWSQLAMKLLDSGDVTDHPYERQFQAFFDAIERGREMPLSSLDDALRTHKVIFAADESAASGKPVLL